MKSAVTLRRVIEMVRKFTDAEIEMCIAQLSDLILDRESFLGDDEDYNSPFR